MVSETILTLIFLGILPRGLSRSTLINVISSRASPGLDVVPLLQLYFRYPMVTSIESIPLLSGSSVLLFISTVISYGALT